MKVEYHPSVQRDVSSILRHYDRIAPRLGDEFWADLMEGIGRAARNPGGQHFQTPRLRRVNLRVFPHHLLFRQFSDSIRVTAVRHNKQHPSTRLSRS